MLLNNIYLVDLFSIPKAGYPFSYPFCRNSDDVGNPIKGFQEPHIKTFKDDLSALPPSERQVYLDRRRQATELITQVSV